jgi:hypothetical protein
VQRLERIDQIKMVPSIKKYLSQFEIVIVPDVVLRVLDEALKDVQYVIHTASSHLKRQDVMYGMLWYFLIQYSNTYRTEKLVPRSFEPQLKDTESA